MEVDSPTPLRSFSPGKASVLATGPVMRLTALWALVESGLGGILHAFHLPVTGVVVGGTAVILITLIAHFAQNSRSILRATLLVLMVKAMVSPHSPLGAYVAVAFQGVAGWAIYSLIPPSLAATSFFAIIALLESALQKLLMLTLFFGAPLWQAVDQWGKWVQESVFASPASVTLSLSQGLVIIYLGLHVVIALLIGWIAYRLPLTLARQQAAVEEMTSVAHEHSPVEKAPKPVIRHKDQRRKWLVGGILVALLVTIVAGETAWPVLTAGMYLLRTILIITVWYWLIAPPLMRLVQRWLLKQHSSYARELTTLLEWFPVFRQQVGQQYVMLAQEYQGWPLYRAWLLRVVVLALITDLPQSRA